MRRGIVTAVGAGVLFGGLLAGPVGAATSAVASGPVKVWVTPSATGLTSSKRPGKVIFTGSIGDYGRDVKANAAGKATKNGTYRLLKMQKGSILVNIGPFQKAETAAFSSPTFNSANCSLSVNVSGPITVVSGSGSYSGITGSVTLTAHFAGIARRASNGSCTTKTTTPALATYTSIVGTGTVTVP
jgi:hypothetical protein